MLQKLRIWFSNRNKCKEKKNVLDSVTTENSIIWGSINSETDEIGDEYGIIDYRGETIDFSGKSDINKL